MDSTTRIVDKGHYIKGQWIKGEGQRFDSTNPASGALLWQGTQATEQDITNAHDAAQNALPLWSNTPFEQRADFMQQFAKQIEQHRNQLAELISLETGKPLWESLTEVTAVIGKINLSIQAYKERTWPKQTLGSEANAQLRFKPQGVVVVLGAFNFPAHLSNGHIIPALIAGNTILYKPSEHCPAVAQLIMDCWHNSGLPAGVINCLQGDAVCGNTLLSQDIQAVYFTGSYATGLRIHQQFSNKPEVILALEMGGNNPLVLGEVTDLKAAIYHSLLSTLITAGQRCTCARRLIVPDSHLGDEFLNRFILACNDLKIGAFTDNPQPFMGPVISYHQAQKHLESQKNLIQIGGKSLLAMTSLQDKTGFLSPGIIDMTEAKNPPDEEVFAPFIQIYRYHHFEDALNLANQTRYGLAAGLLSDDETQYQEFYQKVRAGLINWNRPTTGASSSLPFGGVGLSGNHRASAYFAADYCAYPVASMEQPHLTNPSSLLPGIGHL